MKKYAEELVQYLCILFVSFVATLFVPAESYYGMGVFMLMLAAVSCAAISLIQIIHVGVVALYRRMRNATKH